MGGIKITDLEGKVHELVNGPSELGYADYKEKLAVVSFLFKIEAESHPFI